MPDDNIIEADFKEITADGPDTEAPPDSDLPTGISWPEDMEADTAKELYGQIAAQAIQEFLGVPTWTLFQFESPTSLRFGIRTSNPKPSNEVLHSVLDRIVRELETVHMMEIQEERAEAIADAIDAASELVDKNGIVQLNPNREQKRHPEKFGLMRRQKRVN